MSDRGTHPQTTMKSTSDQQYYYKLCNMEADLSEEIMDLSIRLGVAKAGLETVTKLIAESEKNNS